MIKTIQNILSEGEKAGFSSTEAFGERVEKVEYSHLPGYGIQNYSALIQRVTARAFWEIGDPVGFNLSKPDLSTIKTAFSTIYSFNLPEQKKNYAQFLPKSVEKVSTKIYDDTFASIDQKVFNDLIDQINEILISSPFKELTLKGINLLKILKKINIANTYNLNSKYIKTSFHLRLRFWLRNNIIDISESRCNFNQLEPFRLIPRAYNLLNSITQKNISFNRKNVFLILSPEASAFILKEFSEFFKLDAEKKITDILFPTILNIIDDPTKDGEPGSVPFDDEGQQAKEKYIIKKGAVTQLISSIPTAFQNDTLSSGNGFRNDREPFPAIQFSNLYIKPTILSLRNLMGDAGKGILVSLIKLKYVDKDDYFFSAYGYRFSGKNLLEPVHFYFKTHFLSYFLNILKISKEIKFFHSLYNIGSPYILLEAKNRVPHLLEI
jgi:predicted Zn-dependent protease